MLVSVEVWDLLRGVRTGRGGERRVKFLFQL